MKRRPLATLIGASTLAIGWSPPAAWATGIRAGSVLRIGWLAPGREDAVDSLQERRQLHEWLRRAGHDEGRNLFVERRYAEGDPARLQALALELVQSEVDLIVALLHDAIAAARQATARIPIVMLGGTLPGGRSWVDSPSRSGANVTGIASMGSDPAIRALQLLREAVPSAHRVAVLFNGSAPGAHHLGPGMDRKALSLGLQLEPFDVGHGRDIGPSLRRIATRRIDALLVMADPVIDARLPDILAFSRRSGLVSVGTTRQFAEAGGMLCVEPDRAHMMERAVVYVDRILRGARPQDLPVEPPGRYALIVNLATAEQMGRSLPRQLVQRADGVIE